MHGQALQEFDPEDEESPILADFGVGDDIRMTTFPGETDPRPFTQDDIAYVIGGGRYLQAFVLETGEDTYAVLPAQWNTVNNEWMRYEMGETFPDDYDFGTQCAACHTTGLELVDGTATWIDDGVSCESCHGAGEAHVAIADEAPRNLEDEDYMALSGSIVMSPDPQICGQCHSQGATADAHPFPVGYHPGDTLVSDEGYTLVAPDDPDHWWATGHANAPNMGFNEWLHSAHANSLSTIQEIDGADETCLACHSGDAIWTNDLIQRIEDGDHFGIVPQPLTVDNAEWGVACVTCHTAHPDAESELDFFLKDEGNALCTACHSDPDLTDGIHYPVQQMVEGTQVVEAVEGLPSSHFAAEDGPDCVSCHMPRVPVESFSLASHSLQIVSPATAANIEGLQDSCSECHGEQADPQAMSALIEDIQSGTQIRLDNINAALTGDEPDWVLQALAFVENDSSMGVHNYPYVTELLNAIETELSASGGGNE